MSDRWTAFFADSTVEGAQLALLCLMTGISEELWAAAWLSDLEFALWDAIQNNDPKLGTRVVTERQAALLKLLSEEADGWWVWSDNDGPRFVSLKEWRAIRDR